LRKKSIAPALESLQLKNAKYVSDDLVKVLQVHAENGSPLNLQEYFTYLAFDIICDTAFGYNLGAVSGESKEGRNLYKALTDLTDFQVGSLYSIQ